MRIVAVVLLALLAVVSAAPAQAQGQERGQYDCVLIPRTGELSVVVASDIQFRVARRYELERADRVCTRTRKGRDPERLRSFDVVGTERPVGPARIRILLGRQGNFIDVDTSTATSIMLPESDGTPAYACYRFLSDTPAARLCVPADLNGNGDPAGNLLFCNRGRCRPRKVRGLLGANDLYEGAADANVTLPDGTTPPGAVEVSVRTDVGRLSTTVALGVRDTLAFRVHLESDRVWRFAGERQTGAEAPVELRGTGHATKFRDLSVEAELTSAQGLTTLSFRRQDTDGAYNFRGCYDVTLRGDDAVETTISLPLVMSTNGIGASRPTAERASDGSTVAELAAGSCSVTTSGRVACVIPYGDTDLRLLGVLRVGDPGEGEFAVGASGRSGVWTAVPTGLLCPPS